MLQGTIAQHGSLYYLSARILITQDSVSNKIFMLLCMCGKMCTIGTAESSAYKRYSNFSVEVFFENFIDLKISDQWRTWNINRKKKGFFNNVKETNGSQYQYLWCIYRFSKQKSPDNSQLSETGIILICIISINVAFVI